LGRKHDPDDYCFSGPDLLLKFNGISAPVLYSSATQTNVVVPYEIAGSSTVTVQINGNGYVSPQWTVPIVLSSPAIFTQSGAGTGSAAALNRDGSYNSPSNPAAAGSIIQIFATGAGTMNPAAATGSVTGGSPAQTVLPVSVTIGGQTAVVQSATAAPGEVAGVLQVNCTVPGGLKPGSQPVVPAAG